MRLVYVTFFLWLGITFWGYGTNKESKLETKKTQLGYGCYNPLKKIHSNLQKDGQDFQKEMTTPRHAKYTASILYSISCIAFLLLPYKIFKPTLTRPGVRYCYLFKLLYPNHFFW